MIPGPFKIVASTELSSPSTTITLSDFSAIPAGSKHLVILLNAGASSGVPGVYMRINGDTGANYHYVIEYTTAPSTKTTVTAANYQIVAPAYMTHGTNRFSGGIYIIPRYAETTYHKNVLFLGGDSEYSTQYTCARWINTAAVTSVSFQINSGTFVSGSVAYLAVIDETYKVASETLASDGSITLSAAGTEDDLVFVVDGRTNRGGGNVYDSIDIQLNGDTTTSNTAATTNYRSVHFYGMNGAFFTDVHTGSGGWARQSVAWVAATLGTANATGSGVGLIQRSTNGTYYPHIMAFGGYAADTFPFTWHNSIFRTVTAAITSVKFVSQNGTALVAGFYAAIYKLPRNRILNHTLSSDTEPVGGTLSDTTSPAIAGHLYGRGTSIYDRTVTFSAFNGEIEGNGTNYASMSLFGYNGTMYAESYSSAFDGYIDLETTTGGSPSNLFGGGTTIVIAPSKTDRHKHRFNASGSQAICWQTSSRWKNTAAVTQWTHYANAGAFLTGTQFQVEGITTTVATAATSGFFFRFLSIAAPTVGLAAASSYLSWLTNASV